MSDTPEPKNELVPIKPHPIDSYLNRANVEVSKIVDYKLSDKVIEWYLAGLKPHRISILCNKELEERKKDNPTFTYIPINGTNVNYFLNSRQKELTSLQALEVSPLARKAINIIDIINQSTNMIQAELDKIINPDGPILDSKAQLFIELNRQLLESVKLAASVQGKVQPAINITIFQENINKLVNKIMAHEKIPQEIKEIIVNLILDDLVNDNILKPVQGEDKNK